MSNITSTSTINFFSDTVTAVEIDKVIYVPIKPICENLGIAWASQLEKIKADSLLSKAILSTSMATNSGTQIVIMLSLKHMYGWLMKLNPSKVAPHVSNKLIQYQELIYDVIYDHFHPKSNSTEISINNEILTHLKDFAISHGIEIVKINTSLVTLEKDVAMAFKMQQEQLHTQATEIAVLKATVNIYNEQLRLGVYNQAVQLNQNASKLTTPVKYITIKDTRSDENLKPRVEAYSKVLGYYSLSNKLIKWAAARCSKIEKIGNLNAYPYQLVLDFFNPIHNHELAKIIDFSKFKEYKELY